MGSLDSRSTARRYIYIHNINKCEFMCILLYFSSLDSARDDEHRLIARYAAKLAQEARSGMVRVIVLLNILFVKYINCLLLLL